jgi:hypothetical protein
VTVISFTGGVIFDHFYMAKVDDRSSLVLKVKNLFSFTVFGNKPEFYYLDVEKNGKDYRLTVDDVFEISYRDEFAIKSISTGSLFGRGISVDVEGLGDRNDLMVLLKGIDLVNKRVMAGDNRTDKGYRIIVRYHDDSLASIPVKVKVLPQDWLRFARSSGNKELQIDYLKRAIGMNKKMPMFARCLPGSMFARGWKIAQSLNIRRF